MRFFLLVTFLLLCSISITYAQPPDSNITEVPGDTIEGESTDSTIVYIIKKAPVKIKERIEIQRSKLKKHVYFSLGASLFTNSNTYKAHSGKKEYVTRLNTSTDHQVGVSTIMQLYNAPQKNILGFMLEGKRISEKFHYTPNNGPSNTFQNSYTYGSFGVLVGRWLKKDRKVSYQFMGAPTLNYKIGVSGYSLNQTNTATIFIEEAVAYHQIYLSIYISGKVLLKMKESFVEIVPYATVVPFSMTKKTEAFSIRRHMIGVSLLFTHKIF